MFDRSDGSLALATLWYRVVGTGNGRRATAPVSADSPKRSHACESAVDKADRSYLTLVALARTILIDTDRVAATALHITAEQRQTLYSNGRQAAEDWRLPSR